MGNEVFQQRDLSGVSGQGVTVLDCLGWADPVGDMGLRVFFAAGIDPKAIGDADDAPVRLTQGRMISGGLMALGTGPMGEQVDLPIGEGLRVKVTPPETDLFAGMNVILAEYHGEPKKVLEDWVSHHQAFGLDAVLLIDRRKSGKTGMLKQLAKNSGLKRLVLLQSPVPLGNATLPAADHPFNAPAAPGKDRMGDLPGAPWAAPLGEMALYELCRWRFLSQARAVANLDPSDYLDADAFSAAQQDRVIRLNGTRIYPWRVRKSDPARLHDHICRPFEPDGPNRRWCLAPARLAPDETWRMVHISDVTPGLEMGFHRAMAIRHPNSSPAELIAKTALIEDEALIARAEAAGHKPVRAPINKTRQKRAGKNSRICIVTCMKNEGPFILEWLAWHRAIGVTDVLVYTNDCTDGTDELLDLLQSKGLVERRDNPFEGTGLKPQHAALQAAEKEPALQNADWAISMDVDEFINIHTGEGRLEDLFKAVGEANMISLTWRLFGNAGVDAYEDHFLIDQFTRCAPQICRKPHQAWGFKTLFRNIGLYKKLGVHRPKGLKPDLWDQINWVNGSGKPMPRKLYRNGWRSTMESYGYDLVSLNHYAVRSAESFLVKRDRGRVNHVARDQGLNYWFRMNNNGEQDLSIQSRRDMLVAEYDRLMSDPEIAAAHEFCVTAHRAKIAELKARPDYAEFHSDLISQRMQNLSERHEVFGANVFLEGPQVIPDEIAFDENLPADFFFTVERKKT